MAVAFSLTLYDAFSLEEEAKLSFNNSFINFHDKNKQTITTTTKQFFSQLFLASINNVVKYLST